MESTLEQSLVEHVERRLLREYLDMPGLSLTLAQAARLLGVGEPICRAVLKDLVHARCLARSAAGTFVRQAQRGDLETWKGLMRKRLTQVYWAVSLLLTLCISTATLAAQPNAPGLQETPRSPSSSIPDALREVAFDQRLNERLPLELRFTDEEGREVSLARYFSQRPVVIAFVYYECPMLCTQVLNGLTTAMTALDESVGREFDVITVSFDPRETSVLAAGKKKAYLDRYGRESAAAGWHFLTGEQGSIAALTQAAGFRYAWDADSGQFAHASGIVVATPDGRLSRYFFGIDFAPRDLKFALIEASAGEIGSLADQLLLYCYHYDPATGSYRLVAMNTVRVGGVVTVVGLAGFVTLALWREKRSAR